MTSGDVPQHTTVSRGFLMSSTLYSMLMASQKDTDLVLQSQSHMHANCGMCRSHCQSSLQYVHLYPKQPHSHSIQDKTTCWLCTSMPHYLATEICPAPPSWCHCWSGPLRTVVRLMQRVLVCILVCQHRPAPSTATIALAPLSWLAIALLGPWTHGMRIWAVVSHERSAIGNIAYDEDPSAGTD